ncbi:RHS repeat-associated core domain-containing protein [Flavisolibacter tropicus]|uniref:RHS repeat-associated core domain-containing protein n=1 Tax=Flavisolibacter tropicus TaxID=1492898 RepID=UPI00082DFD13|nr:RHS repeat-associated core domain-containing protein [Flavisolibacter tropicus]
MTNHLDNVLAVVSGHKVATASGNEVNILSQQDYYPFGMGLPERKWGNSYRYGFNGKENDKESGTQDYGLRIYNPALGRFLSVDPLTKSYPMLTPYQFASNSPIDGIDLDGLEYLSFHKSMYRMEYQVMRQDIKMGDGTKQTVTTSSTVVNTVYSNIPAALQDSKAASFKFVGGGPVTTMGRDYDPNVDGAWQVDWSKYYANGPSFYGAAEGGKSTNGIQSLKGNASMQRQVLAQNINGVGGAFGANGAGGMIVNRRSVATWKALTLEGDLRNGFYNATQMVDYYMNNNMIGNSGKDLSGGADRAMLINFLSDGYLPTAETDKFKGPEFTSFRRNAYEKQLTVAWHGLEIMQAQNITIREETKSSIRSIVGKYLQDGGNTTPTNAINEKLDGIK